MLRKLFTPQWLALGLLALAAFATCLRLGWWQWTRFLDGDGDFQNLGYTALWPVFGVFAIYLWWRLLADAARSKDSVDALVPAGPGPSSERSEQGEADADSPARRRRGRTRPPRVQLPYDPAERVAERVVDEQEDPELAAYNRYLASLNATPEVRR